MQRLHPAVEHLGEAGDRGHVRDLEPGLGQRLAPCRRSRSAPRPSPRARGRRARDRSCRKRRSAPARSDEELRTSMSLHDEKAARRAIKPERRPRCSRDRPSATRGAVAADMAVEQDLLRLSRRARAEIDALGRGSAPRPRRGSASRAAGRQQHHARCHRGSSAACDFGMEMEADGEAAARRGPVSAILAAQILAVGGEEELAPVGQAEICRDSRHGSRHP